MKLCKHAGEIGGVYQRCSQDVELEPVPGTSRVERRPLGSETTIRSVNDYRPDSHGWCYYHNKIAESLLQPMLGLRFGR